MSLSALKTAAYDILQVASPSAEDDVTLLLCFNHARLQAERKHDFELSKGTAYLNVVATTGSLLSSATDAYTANAPAGSAVAIKSIRRGTKVRNTDDDGWVDAEVMSFEKYAALQTRANRGASWSPLVYSNEPAQNVDLFQTKNVLYIDGGRLFTHGTTSIDVQLKVYTWLSTYASFAATADFLITYCPDFLLWSAIQQFNHKKGVFLPRNEGSIDPGSPLGMANAAWEAAVIWDRYMVDHGGYIISE